MTACQLTTVLLDFGGVIAEEGFAVGIKSLAASLGADPHVLWQAGLSAVWDSGYVHGRGSEADFWALFKERTGVTGDEQAWREAILDGFVVRPWVLALVDRLRGLGVAVAILSDQTDWLERLDRRQRFTGHFDAVFNSYHHGMSKLEDAFFHLALRELAADPAATLFVDDNPVNVERAKALGMHAVLYETRQGLEQALQTLCPALAGK